MVFSHAPCMLFDNIYLTCICVIYLLQHTKHTYVYTHTHNIFERERKYVFCPLNILEFWLRIQEYWPRNDFSFQRSCLLQNKLFSSTSYKLSQQKGCGRQINIPLRNKEMSTKANTKVFQYGFGLSSSSGRKNISKDKELLKSTRTIQIRAEAEQFIVSMLNIR